MTEFRPENSDLYRLAVEQNGKFELALAQKYRLNRKPSDEARIDGSTWLGLRIGWYKVLLAAPGVHDDDKRIAQRYLHGYELLWDEVMQGNWQSLRDEFLQEARESFEQAASKEQLGFQEAARDDEPEAQSYVNFAHSLEA